MPKEYHEIQEVEILYQKDKAVKIMTEDGEEHWIPWSLVEDNDEDFKNGYRGPMSIEKWFLEREEII